MVFDIIAVFPHLAFESLLQPATNCAYVLDLQKNVYSNLAGIKTNKNCREKKIIHRGHQFAHIWFLSATHTNTKRYYQQHHQRLSLLSLFAHASNKSIGNTRLYIFRGRTQ